MALKCERFKIAGVQYYSDNIGNFLIYPNDDYKLPKKELIEAYEYEEEKRIFENSFLDMKVELVPEPENPHDPNAIRVDASGVQIGYIKAGSTSHVKNLLNSPDFYKMELKMGGGNFKRLCEDEDGGYTIERGSTGFFADLYIYTGQPEPQSAPASVPRQNKPLNTKSTPAPEPSPKPERPMSAPRSPNVFGLFFAILFYAAGIWLIIKGVGYISESLYTGAVVFMVAAIFILLGVLVTMKSTDR